MPPVASRIMRFSTILPILITAGLISAQVPVLSEYDKLFKLCEDGGANSVSDIAFNKLIILDSLPQKYVGVQYANGYTTTFQFGKCYPYSINGVLAQMAVFCKAATCYNNP